MRMKFKGPNAISLLKAATILSIGGLAAGCSSDVLRFNDGFYTGAVPQQAASASGGGYGQPNYNPGIDPSSTGSIRQQGQLPRPSDSRLAPPHPVGNVGDANYGSAAPAPTYAPQSVASAPLAPAGSSQPAQTYSQPMTTASIPSTPKPAATAPSSGGGWSSGNGGAQVRLQSGETIYTLSRRYGVPAKSIMEANGITDATSVRAGQVVTIPTYSYSRNAAVSAPDNNPAVARASASAPAPRPETQSAMLRAPEPAPARNSVIADGGRYTVVSGDTLSAISRRTGASVSAIKQVNGMTTDTVRLGQKLIIPGLTSEKVASAQVKPVDPIRTSSVERVETKKPAVKEYTPPKQAAGGENDSIRKIETASTAKSPGATGVKSMRWPVQGRVIGAFGSNNGGKPNDGIDISVPKGTPVKAAENGVVIYAGDGLKELGQTILVRHEDGLVTVYGHVSKIDVKRGQDIKRGQQIASSGMSGAAKQPQLHFEVRKNSKPVNPASFLE